MFQNILNNKGIKDKSSRSIHVAEVLENLLVGRNDFLFRKEEYVV